MSDDQHTQRGISLKTLLIAAAASATAALIVPLLWKPGTVFAAAMTPIIVTLGTEILKRPADTVSSVAVRRPAAQKAGVDPPPEPFDPLAPASAEELEALPRTTASLRSVHRRRMPTLRQWRLAIVTGLAAFLGAVGVVTASELVAGERVGGTDDRTTFFGGSRRDVDAGEQRKPDERRERKPSPTPTTTPSRTPAPTPTPSATPTPGATPTPTSSPVPTATPPGETAPAPLSEPPAAPPPAP